MLPIDLYVSGSRTHFIEFVVFKYIIIDLFFYACRYYYDLPLLDYWKCFITPWFMYIMTWFEMLISTFRCCKCSFWVLYCLLPLTSSPWYGWYTAKLVLNTNQTINQSTFTSYYLLCLKHNNILICFFLSFLNTIMYTIIINLYLLYCPCLNPRINWHCLSNASNILLSFNPIYFTAQSYRM